MIEFIKEMKAIIRQDVESEALQDKLINAMIRFIQRLDDPETNEFINNHGKEESSKDG